MVRTSLKISAFVAALLLAAAAGSSHQALAEGALAIGLPSDVSKDGIALGWNTNSPTSAEARRRALEGCRDVKNSTDAARALCTIVGTFHNQCVAGAEDPAPGTPGVGWAVAADKLTAEQQALAMCQAKSPPARRAACKVMTSGCDRSAALASPGQQPPATPPKAPTGSSSGSGFFLTQAGNVLTNAHVVQGCDDIRIRMADGSLIRARVIAINEVDDLAVLKADTRAEKVVTLRTTPSPRSGEPIVVFGFPLPGLLASTGNGTTGNITALAGLRDDPRQMQISAPVQPGNSGGPLIDMSGNVVGVVVSKLDALRVARVIEDIPQNINFAIKASTVANFLDAKGLTHSAGQAGRELSVPEVVERAKRYSVEVKCSRY